MEEPLTIAVYSPEETLYSGSAKAVFLPGSMGPFEVLRSHAPIISALVQGEIRIVAGDGTVTAIPVKGGFAKVKENKVTVCAEK